MMQAFMANTHQRPHFANLLVCFEFSKTNPSKWERVLQQLIYCLGFAASFWAMPTFEKNLGCDGSLSEVFRDKKLLPFKKFQKGGGSYQNPIYFIFFFEFLQTI